MSCIRRTESSEAKVESDDDEIGEGGQDASVVRISGSDVVVLGVNEQHDRKQRRLVHC